MTTRFRTGDLAWIRERNSAIVMNHLWSAGSPSSRSSLVAASGLNKGTVGSLLTQLADWGFAKVSGISSKHPGRPGILYEVNPDGGRVIGAEIGVGFLSLIVSDMVANVVWRKKLEKTDAGEDFVSLGEAQLMAHLECLVEEAISHATQKGHRLLGMGVGVPGLVESSTGALLFAPNLHWRNVPVSKHLRERFGIPVVVANEAKAAALAEWMFGEAKGIDDFVYLSAGVGLGGGLMINRHLYGGIGGFAGEVGHMTIIPDGPLCNCGNKGCWEVLVGPMAILEKVRSEAALGHAHSMLAKCDNKVEAIGITEIQEAAQAGEPVVIETLGQVGRILGIGIANLINVFNPRLVVLGGVLSLFGPYILPYAQEEASARALKTSLENVKICLSAFRFDACAMGGVAIILREVLNNPAVWQPTHPSREVQNGQLNYASTFP